MSGVNVYNYCHGQAAQAGNGTQGKNLVPQNYKSGVSSYPRGCEASGPEGACLLQSKAIERNPAMKEPRSKVIAEKGIRTPADLQSFLSALMSDTLTGHVKPGTANRICKEVGQRLKRVEISDKVRRKVQS